MRAWQLIIITYITFVMQTSLVHVIEIGGVRPNLVVMGLLLLIPNLSGRLVLLTAAVWGLFSDALAPACPGIDLVCFAMAAFVLWHFQRQGISQTLVGRIVVLFPAAFVLLCSCRLLREIASGTISPADLLIKESAMTAGFTAALGSLVLIAAAFRPSRPGSSIINFTIRNSWKMLTQ